jgi:hypothetical protein
MSTWPGAKNLHHFGRYFPGVLETTSFTRKAGVLDPTRFSQDATNALEHGVRHAR